MPATLLSILAIIAALSLGIWALCQKQQRSLASVFLAIGLFLMAGIEGADRVALDNPDIWVSAKTFTLVLESLLGATWLLYALTFARKAPLRNLSPVSMVLLAGTVALPVVTLTSTITSFFFSPDFDVEQILFLDRSAYWFYLGLMFFTVAALYHLERTLLAFSAMERFPVLHEIIGIGIILVAMLVYYSHALLHRTIDMNLVPIRSLALLAGSGLCGYSRLRRGATQGLAISRDVVSRSLIVLAVGCYLLLLGGAGEGLRYVGVENQRLFYIGFAVLSGLLLALMLLSEKNRRKLMVFLYKHFYRHKYDYRNEWLMFTAQLSSADNMGKLQNAILEFYCETFGRKGAALYLRDLATGTYQQKASCNLEFHQSSFLSNHPLVVYFNETNWVFNADDTHPDQLDSIKRQFEPFKVQLCIPLQYEGNLEGFILLGEAINPGEKLIFEDYDLMKVLARQATSVLLSLKLSAQLSTAQEMAAIGKVSTFVIHDLKNHVSNLTLMVDNARDHMANPEFQRDMIETLDETIGKINTLISRLKNIKEKKELNLAPCNLTEVVHRGAKASGNQPEIVQSDAIRVYIDAAEIEKVVHNLVLNACEAGSAKGSVTISVGMGDSAFFEVADRGCGMSEDFIRNRLFQPFQTTKKKGFGIGLYQCRQIIEAHGGRIEVSSKAGEGTSFKVHLPSAD
ncbi:MAG: XrtA/PEP-CTERM system histidine kinase PrsK [Desulfuromonadales bacterium]